MPGSPAITFGYFSAALAATAGIALFSGVQFAVIALWRRRESTYFSYAAVCLCIAGLAFGNAALDASVDFAGARSWLRLMIAVSIVFFVPFVHFVDAYTGDRRSRGLLAATVVLGALFTWINLSAPYTLFFRHLVPGEPLALPWGERLFGLAGTPSAWGSLFHLYTYLVFLWALWRAVHQFRRGDKVCAGLLGACLFAQFAALLWGDLAIDLAGVRAPYLDSFAFLPFVLLMAFSLATARAQAERALIDSEQRYRTLFEQVDDGFCILERIEGAQAPAPRFRFLAANRAFAAQTGAEPTFGRTIEEVVPTLAPYWSEVLEQVGRSGVACHFEHAGGEGEHALEHYACRLSDGEHPRVALVVRDVTARRRSEERQRMLVNELNHRVKNTLATVQSVAMQSLRESDDPAQAYQRFEGRLLALSRVHDVLTRESWVAASLDTIVEQALAPYRDGRGERIRAEGQALRLPPSAALAFAMALHELATNATKYGALSTQAGIVTVQWKVEPGAAGRVLTLQWTEAGGPPVAPPGRRGFGLRLLERGLAYEIGGQVQLAFLPGGVVCTIRAVLGGTDSAAVLSAHLLDRGPPRAVGAS